MIRNEIRQSKKNIDARETLNKLCIVLACKAKSVAILNYKTVEDFNIFDPKTMKNQNFNRNIRLLNSLDDLSSDIDFLIINSPAASRDKRGFEASWSVMEEAFKKINDSAKLINTVLPNFWMLKKGKDFIKELNKKKRYINAVFQAPDGTYETTYLKPHIILCSNSNHENLFISKLTNNHSATKSATNYLLGYTLLKEDKNFSKSDNIVKNNGGFVKISEFKGFNNYFISRQIDLIRKNYNNYKETPLLDLVKEINQLRYGKDQQQKFDKIDNSIYLRRIGLPNIITNLHKTDLKHSSYFQLVLNKEKIINRYAEEFYKSKLGNLILGSVQTGISAKHISKESFEELLIALPSIENQKNIVKVSEQLNILKNSIDDLSNELSLNPKNADEIFELAINVKNAFSKISDADKIRELIRIGESQTIEFKETLNFCTRSKDFKPFIQDQAFKNIVGMLNAEGGTILIGVADNGDIKGIQRDLKKFKKRDNDSLLNHMSDLVGSRIGNNFITNIKYEIIHVDKVDVLKIHCKKSNIPCYLDNKVFYIRTSPTARALEGPEMVQYISDRFKK